MSENKQNHENNEYQILVVKYFLSLQVLSKHSTFSVICKLLRPHNRNPVFTHGKSSHLKGLVRSRESPRRPVIIGIQCLNMGNQRSLGRDSEVRRKPSRVYYRSFTRGCSWAFMNYLLSRNKTRYFLENSFCLSITWTPLGSPISSISIQR